MPARYRLAWDTPFEDEVDREDYEEFWGKSDERLARARRSLDG
jgi:hypothetical protein